MKRLPLLGRRPRDNASTAITQGWQRSRLIEASIVMVFGFSIHGAIADFCATDMWTLVSFVLAFPVTIAAYVALLYAPPPFGLRDARDVLSHASAIILLLLFVGGGSWSVIGKSWPDLLTRAWGSETTRDVRLDKRKVRAGKFCSYPLTLHVDRARSFRYCAGRALYDGLPDYGTAHAAVRESRFGVHIVSLTSAEN